MIKILTRIYDQHSAFGMSEANYSVTPEQLVYWSAEVQKLLALTELVCREKIERLRAREL